jgi:putative DNA primase/helicase
MSRRDVIRLTQAAPVVAPLLVRRVADIDPQPVLWLWPGRVARGKVTMLAGHPGLGKSQLALGIAAIVTSGGQWPVDRARAERGSAIILSAEDDPADTIRPRLEAAGADLERCHIIEAAQDIGDDGRPQRRGFSLVEDLARLDAELQHLDDATIVVIDPITAYCGAVDSHRNAEVRGLLAPLAELAAQRRVAILAISHLRKSLEGDAILQVSGSLAFVAAARAAFVVTRDKADDRRRLLLPLKNNIGNDRTGYAYGIELVSLSGSIETCRIVWEPEAVTVTADEAMAPSAARAQPRPRDIAVGWLRDLLANGPFTVRQIQAEAKAAGLSWATVRRGADQLGITTEKTAYEGGWAWRLPHQAGEEIDL